YSRARDIDDEGAVGKSGADAFGAGDVDAVAKRGAKPAAYKNQEIVEHAESVRCIRRRRFAACGRLPQGAKTKRRGGSYCHRPLMIRIRHCEPPGRREVAAG